MEVRELSIGDYVLNGGEVAALAIVEAVVRLLPGFMGNAESLTEESHADGLLEYPVYTKPAAWRGHEVPEVLLSGDHARIAAVAPRPVRTTYRRAPPGPRPPLGRRRPRVARGRAQRSPCPPTPPSCSPCSARAGSRSSRRTRAWRSRRTRRASPTCRRGCEEWTTLVLRVGGRLIGAARGSPGRRHLGHRPHHGRPGPAGTRDRPAAARRDRAGRAGRGYASSCCSPARAASATSGCTRRPATASSAPTPSVAGAVRLTKRRR